MRVLLVCSGNLGYSQASLSYTSTDPASGKPVNFSGSYVLVWKRQADNSWKAVEDISTPGAPPASK